MLRAPDLLAMAQIPEVHKFPESFLLVCMLAVHHDRVRQSLASLSMLWRLFPSLPPSLWQAFSCSLPAECGYFNQLCHMLGFIQNKYFEMGLSLSNIPWDFLHSFSWLPKWIFLKWICHLAAPEFNHSLRGGSPLFLSLRNYKQSFYKHLCVAFLFRHFQLLWVNTTYN